MRLSNNFSSERSALSNNIVTTRFLNWKAPRLSGYNNKVEIIIISYSRRLLQTAIVT